MYRTHDCGALRLTDLNSTVTLSGWVQISRDLGGLTFVDLRDRYGITQLVFNMDTDAALCEHARKLGREFVIQVTGTVQERSNKNPNRPTGDIEIEGTTVGVSSRPRIVRMQGHAMEIEIGRHMAVFEYSDVPGMIGRVGTILGDAGVNVAGMAVDRRDGGAMMVLNVDSEVPREAQERITNIEGFESVWFVTLPDLGVAE